MKRAPVARVRPAELRERIEASLRARSTTHDARVEVHGRDDAWSAMATNNGHMTLTSVVSNASELGALEALAEAMGLNADGSDPRTELDQLDALLARQHAILTGVADALRGDPGPLASHSHHDLAERAAATVAEAAQMRAIVEGSDVPPTDAEVEAHERANGLGSSWLCMWEGRPRVIENSSGVRYIRGTGGRPWWPLDAKCRPCAWPVVEVSR
jgi:hypothetical protein